MPHLPSRAAWIATVVALPAVISALTAIAIEAKRMADPEAPLFGGPPPASLTQAITEKFGVEQTYQFIRAGADPNAALPFEHSDYTEGKTIAASPLLLAVAAGDSSAVQMLLSFGARLDLPQNRHVECLARELRNQEIIAILADRRGETAPPSCSDRKPDAGTPLVAWGE
jgi:hypothetical protein